MAMKKQPEITLRLSEDMLRKLLYVSSAEGRAPDQHLIMLLRNSVQYFERAKGRIKQADLQKLDLSAYYGKTPEAEDAVEQSN